MPQYLGKSERARRLDFLLDMEWFVIRLFMAKKLLSAGNSLNLHTKISCIAAD